MQLSDPDLMGLPHRPSLANARDPLAHAYQPTARIYDEYLSGEYDANYNDRALKPHWDAHYGEMRTVFMDHVCGVLERGKQREDMNVGILGPGMRPVGKDISETLLHSLLRKARRVIVIDFSTVVVRSAMEALLSAGVRPDRLMGKQFDITDGLSTAYTALFRDRVASCAKEEQLSQVTEEIANITLEDLEERLAAIETSLMSRHSEPEPFLRGGVNLARNWKFQETDGDRFQLDLLLAPDVFNGTGAAAENIYWTTYHEITSDPQLGAREPSVETREDRLRMFRNIFKLIARYNTRVTAHFLPKVFADNPDCTVVAVNDVSTKFPHDAGELPRVYSDDLREALEALGISVRLDDKSWDWHDEPEHSHRINCLRYRRAASRAKNGTGSEQPIRLNKPSEARDPGGQSTDHAIDQDKQTVETSAEPAGVVVKDDEGETQDEPKQDAPSVSVAPHPEDRIGNF